jgi:hypothetical protein
MNAIGAVLPTFESICALEPHLLELEAKVKAIKDDGQSLWFCAIHRWMGCAGCDRCNGGIKRELVRLVGWGAENPRLRTEGAYDVAYDHLYALLPPCRDCDCL